MSKGTAFIDVPVAELSQVLSFVPHTYSVVGSVESRALDTVRLVLESEFIEGHGSQMVLSKRDVGSTRRILILPA